jgi:hypothetical protein
VFRGGYEIDPKTGAKLLTLEGAASEWMAPVADDIGTRMKRCGQGGTVLSLQASIWPGPQASEVRQGYQRRPEGMASEQSQQSLSTIAADCSFLPPISQAPTTPPDGETSSTAGQNTNQHSPKRKLNPIFVEALMRWPTGLSGFKRQETAWTRWWLLMPTFVSMLCSQKPERQMSLL